jgi:predicted dithiol-disulfide oxidoreductase (DUF899 family)
MTVSDHKIVTRDEWVAARKALLAKEKSLMRAHDELARERRALPWVRVEKPYAFDGARGRMTLADLFGDKSQLVVYHFMFAPEWDAGCKHCSFWADNFDGADVHLRHRDVSFVTISRAPLAKIDAFKKRMGWRFPWVSSAPSDFNYDFNVSFTPEARRAGTAVYNFAPTAADFADREGISVFAKDATGAVCHTYGCFARGIEPVNATYAFLDLVPKGRDEEAEEFAQFWVRHHDAYED